MKLSIIFLLMFVNCFLFIPDMIAQEAQSGDEDIFKNSLRDITVVTATGLSGAIIGLSTLPFTEVPKEHYRNILVGGALGVILGVGLVAWGQADKGRKTYTEVTSEYVDPGKHFNSDDKYTWQGTCRNNYLQKNSEQPITIAYSFSF